MKMHSIDKYSVSCVVIATEDGDVILLEPQTFSQLCQVRPMKRILLLYNSYLALLPQDEVLRFCSKTRSTLNDTCSLKLK